MVDNELWLAIYDLYELLIDQVNEENAYQSYFENHPIVFSVLGYDAAVPFDKRSPHKLPYDSERDYRPEPDFICAIRLSGEVTVFELKTPFQFSSTTSRSDGNRKKFKATVESHLAQASEYVDTIREREDARVVVRDALHLSQISSYKISITYGLSDSKEATSVARLADNRKIPTQIIPYDVLLDLLLKQYSISGRDVESRPGWCFCWHIVIAPTQKSPKAYIFDMGAPGCDRVSMYVESELLVLECIDSLGNSHKFPCSFTPHEPLYIRFEFSTDKAGILISCNVNNEEVNLRVGRNPLEIAPDIGLVYLGADINGSHGACFKLREKYFVNRTMDTKERLGSFHYFKHKTVQSGGCAEFTGTSCMTMDADWNMVAIGDDRRPIYRDSANYP